MKRLGISPSIEYFYLRPVSVVYNNLKIVASSGHVEESSGKKETKKQRRRKETRGPVIPMGPMIQLTNPATLNGSPGRMSPENRLRTSRTRICIQYRGSRRHGTPKGRPGSAINPRSHLKRPLPGARYQSPFFCDRMKPP